MGFKDYLDLVETYSTSNYYNSADIINLSNNENPLGLSKKAIKAIIESATNSNKYPNSSFIRLKNALSNKYNVDSNNIIIGNGSDEIISMIIRAVCDKDSKILTSLITFSMYKIYASLNQVRVVNTKSGIHKPKEFIESYKSSNPDLIFLCVPNNPLGDCLNKDEVYEILDYISKDTFVVLDCAYADFASYKDKKKKLSPKEIIKDYSNVFYLGTFSKLYGLGGLRVGYGISCEDNIKYLSKFRSPYNITSISENAAIASLNDDKFVKRTLKNNFLELAKYEKFASKYNIEYINSYTNFITLIFDDMTDSNMLCKFLFKKGIIVRNLSSYGLNAIRITIGKKEANIKVIKFLTKYLKG